MRSIWTIASFFAIVHLLALLLFIGWLWRSDRLDMDRVQQLRDLLAPTISEQTEMEESRQQSEVTNAELTRLPSAEQIVRLTTLQEQEQKSAQRMKDESDMLARQFELLAKQTEAEREAFEIDRQRWEDATRAERERKTDEQFAQTVQQYESLPAKQSKDMLLELIGKGQQQQAVAYLDAMKPRAANKILKEFKSPTEIVLATELLEELRTFGLGTVDPKESGNDDTGDITEKSAS